MVGRRIVLSEVVGNVVKEEILTSEDFMTLLSDLADTPEMWSKDKYVEVSERIYEERKGVYSYNFIGEMVYYEDYGVKRFGWKLNLCS